MTEAYPLHWPPGWPRRPANQRTRARYAERARHLAHEKFPATTTGRIWERRLDNLEALFTQFEADVRESERSELRDRLAIFVRNVLRSQMQKKGRPTTITQGGPRSGRNL